MSSLPNQKIEKACQEALKKFQQIGSDDHNEVQSKLEFVLGSYKFDQNPVGLYEIGAMALSKLKGIKKQKPKLVSQKLIDSLEKALTTA